MKMVLIGCKICFDDGFVVDFFIAKTDNTNLIAGISLCAPVFTTLMAFGNIFGQGVSSLGR